MGLSEGQKKTFEAGKAERLTRFLELGVEWAPGDAGKDRKDKVFRLNEERESM